MKTARDIYDVRQALVDKFLEIEQLKKMQSEVQFSNVNDRFNEIVIDGKKYEGLSYIEIQ